MARNISQLGPTNLTILKLRQTVEKLMSIGFLAETINKTIFTKGTTCQKLVAASPL